MLYLIDSSIYIFRAWQTLPASITNSFGEQANAVHGFTAMLAKVLSDKKPDYIVCAFDKSSGTGKRYTLFPDYKANREPAPPELKQQFERCIQIADALGIPGFSSTAIEADDIIGICAGVAQIADMPVTIVSADKDLTQFITENDLYWNYAKKQTFTYTQLVKQFKVRPDQIADMLALCGDTVANVPGIPGVGQTTAARLLKKWQTLDRVFENSDAIAKMSFRGAPRVATLVQEYEETVRLSRQLTGLVTDSAMPKTLTKLKLKKRPKARIRNLLMEAGVSESGAERLAEDVTQSRS